MKNLKIVLSGMIFCISFGFGQTNVIALKSRAGNTSELLQEKDNFGEHPGMSLSSVDSVKYFAREKALVTYHSSRYGSTRAYTDSVSYVHETYEQIEEHLKAIRLNNWYPEKTKFIGFPKEIEKMLEYKGNGIKLNTISIWFVLSLLGLGAVLKSRK